MSELQQQSERASPSAHQSISELPNFPISSAPPASLMRLEALTKVYQMGDQEVRALDGVDLHVDEGEFISIMGPSGSGKSTLMHVLGCLDAPTSGRYWLNGQEVSQLDDEALAKVRNRTIGFVFQSFNLLPSMTALENVELPMIYGGKRERRPRAAEALRRVGLGDRMNHKPTELSGGQQQRVAIARAIANDPRIIMADEPTGNISTRQGEEILAVFQELNDAGITCLIVTHEPDIARHSRRLVQMQDGQVIADEQVRERISAHEWLEANPERARIVLAAE
jgi:putative ABC transport system ATP-binding protein